MKLRGNSLFNGVPNGGQRGLFVDGSAALPGFGLASERTGFYKKAASQLGVSLDGVAKSYFVGNGLASANGADAAKFLRGDGSWQALPGGGDMLAANNLADVADRLTSLNTLIRDGAGEVALSAGGANQNVLLTPTGTGIVRIDAPVFRNAADKVCLLSNNTGANYMGLASAVVAGRSAWQLGTVGVPNASGVIASLLNLLNNGTALFNTATDSGNGLIQLASHTTITGGLGFGTDSSIWRTDAGALQTNARFLIDGPASDQNLVLNNAGNYTSLYLYHASNQRGQFYWDEAGRSLVLGASTGAGGGDVRLTSGANLTALTLNATQTAIFAGALRLANAFAAGAPAATGYVTVQDSTGTTYKLLCAP